MSTDAAIAQTPAETDLETQLEQDTNVVDDVVLDEEAEEKKNAELVDQVEKCLRQDETAAEESKEPKEPKQQAGGDDEKAPAEGTDDEKKPDDLSQALKTRAQEAGIHETLAERLHQSGLLEESLAALDRQLIDAVAQNEAMQQQQYQQSTQTQPPPQRQAPLQETDQNRSGGDDAPPPLDVEDYDEKLIARDAYHQKRIDRLEAQQAQFSQLASGFIQQQSVQLDEWFDKTVEALDNEELFGKGDIHSLPQGSPQQENRIKLFRAYKAVCLTHGANHLDCNKEFARRAYPAVFHDQVFKAAQQQTAERLRDAQGKFISPSRPSGGGPPLKKRQTPEEMEDALVEEVQGILDRPRK